MPKVLIGAPINVCKDYAAEKWLEAVSRLDYPADLLVVDNSPGLDYVTKLRGYCEKYGIKNYKIEHLEINPGQSEGEKIGRSREVIREEVLRGGYDVWFSLESDIIVPPNTLSELMKVIGDFNFMMITHAHPARTNPADAGVDFGIALIKKELLLKYGFILNFDPPEPGMPQAWHKGEGWFMKRVLRDGGNYGEIYGIIKPIYHLNG